MKTGFRSLKKEVKNTDDLATIISEIISETEGVKFDISEREYQQKIYFFGRETSFNLFHVVAMVPDQKIPTCSLKLGRKGAIIQNKIILSEDLISFSLSVLPGTTYFIRLYLQPTEEVNLEPPSDFKKILKSKNNDSI